MRRRKKAQNKWKRVWEGMRIWGGGGVWLKDYCLSQGPGCQSVLVAFVVPPFHCDLTLIQGETRDKHSDLSSISHLTPSLSLSVFLKQTHANPSVHAVLSQSYTASFSPGYSILYIFWRIYSVEIKTSWTYRKWNVIQRQHWHLAHFLWTLFNL